MTATTTIAMNMKMVVAVMERAESRAIPQMPWPEVQPPPSRLPKPTRRPAAMIMTQLAGICGDGMAYPTQLAVRGARMSSCNKSTAPGFVVYSEAEAASEYATDAGDPAGQQHQQCGRKADQRTADRRGDRSKIGHDITSRCCPLVSYLRL